jgi:tRNA-binding protein
MATLEDFEKLDIRVGRIVEVEDFPEGKKPAFKLKIDFGSDIGIKKSIGQFKKHYSDKELKGKLVACVVNFPPRQMGPAVSETLTLGFPDEENQAVLVTPDKEIPLGGKLF